MHSLFISPASSEAWFNAQADILGNNGPALVMCLSADGTEPATHGWCAITISESKEAEVAILLAENPEKGVLWSKYSLTDNPSYPSEEIARIGLKLIETPLAAY